MSHVTVDVELANKLCGLSETVELRDPSGRVLGQFAPLTGANRDDRGRPPISEEELQRREQEEEDYSTAEVLAYLEKL
jgi:hypothetical protein